MPQSLPYEVPAGYMHRASSVELGAVVVVVLSAIVLVSTLGMVASSLFAAVASKTGEGQPTLELHWLWFQVKVECNKELVMSKYAIL